MIKYHGTPFGGIKDNAAEALIGRHAFVSYADPSQLDIALDVCQSVALDNGAFSAWRSGKKVDWDDFFKWAKSLMNHPRIDWAIIPDVIDGDEEANLKLMARFIQFFGSDALSFGVPVWHMHESDEKLNYLSRAYKRIAIGSSGKYSIVGDYAWHQRMNLAMRVLCDNNQPRCKVHMLRGLDTDVFPMYPFSSADSTNAARNCRLEDRWQGTYVPPSSSWKARVIMARIESVNSAEKWTPQMEQLEIEV